MASIVKAYVTTQRPADKPIATVRRSGGSSTQGRVGNAHMQALLERAMRDGIRIETNPYGED